jgi:hypothetical protein
VQQLVVARIHAERRADAFFGVRGTLLIQRLQRLLDKSAEIEHLS